MNRTFENRPITVRWNGMQPDWKILAPIDLSADPEEPVEHAISVARAMGADLTLLYVRDHRGNRRERPLGWPRDAFGAAPCGIHRMVLPGNVSETITSYSEFVNAGLVVMTSDNSRGWTRHWKSSVTDRVMASTRRPVYLADLRAVNNDSYGRFRRILCVLNLDGTDEPVVHQAAALARRSGGELILLGVVPEISEGLLLETVTGMDRPLTTDLAVERIRELRKEVSVSHKTSVMIGSPYECISAAARKHAVDVVVASRATSGESRSYALDARSILRSLPCPLISVAEELPAALFTKHSIADAAPVFSNASGF